MLNSNDPPNLEDDNSIAKSKKINSDDSSNSSLILPEINKDILSNILTWLPVKSLIRFESVRKSWKSYISSYKFAKSHLDTNFFLARQFIIPNFETSTFTLLTYDEFNNLETQINFAAYDVSCFNEKDLTLDVVRVCNGLLCLCYRYTFIDEVTPYHIDDEHFFFTVFNPITQRSYKIASPDSRSFLNLDIWFGHVSSIDDYKILVRFVFDNHNYVYSLRSGTWKSLSDLDRVLLPEDVLKNNTTVFNDLLYWSLRDKGYATIQPKEIIGFNLVTEQVQTFPSLDWLSAYSESEFFVMNGCLSLFCTSTDPNSPISDIWMLKQQDDWRSWEKSVFVHNEGFFLHSVSAAGKFLVAGYDMEHNMNKFKILDASKYNKEQSEGDACFLPEEMIEDGGFYVESLIWPFEISDSNQHLIMYVFLYKNGLIFQSLLLGWFLCHRLSENKFIYLYYV